MTKEALSTVDGCLAAIGADSARALDVFCAELPEAVAHLRTAEPEDARARLLLPFVERCCALLGAHGEASSPAGALLGETQIIDLVRSLTAAQFAAGFDEHAPQRARLAKALIALWAAHPADAVRIAAVLGIHGLCVRYTRNGAMLETCFASMFKLYAAACRTLTAHSLGRASLLAAGIVEVLMVNPERAAALVLVKLRSLAAEVQAAMRRGGSAKAARDVVAWTVVARLRVFVHLVATAQASAGGKRYAALAERVREPLARVLVALGAYAPGVPRFFPFQMHLVAMAGDLATGAGGAHVFVPVANVCLRVVAHTCRQPLWRMETRKTAYDMGALCRVSQSEARTRGYLESAADEALYQLLALLARASREVFFPELAAPIVARLRDVAERGAATDRTLRGQILGHVAKIAQAAEAVVQRRRARGLTPAGVAEGRVLDAAGLDSLPTYVEALGRVRTARRKLLLDGASDVARDANDSADEDEDEDVDAAGSDDEGEDALDVVLGSADAKPKRAAPATKPKPSKRARADTPAEPTEDVFEDFVVA